MDKGQPYHPQNVCSRKTRLDSVEIYDRCQRGEQEAWNILYRIICKNIIRSTHNDTIYRLDSIEDIAQDIVCCLLAGGIDKVEDPAAFFGFVKTMIRYRILDRFKKKFPTPIPIGPEGDDDKPGWDPPSEHPSPEFLARGIFFLEDIVSGISRLSEKCHAPLTEYIAYKKDGKYTSYNQLAKKMNMKLGTLSSRITRCLEELSRQPDIRQWLEV